MRAVDPRSSDSTSAGAVPVISRILAAYARADVWSVAMTSPPASGIAVRTWDSRWSAARSTAGTQSPAGSSAVRQARATCSAVPGSPSRADSSSPARVRHRASPEYARKITGRTTPSRSASPYPYEWSAADRSAPSGSGSYRTNGIGFSSERNGVPVSASRRAAGSNASRTASPQDSASPAWCTSSSTTRVRRFAVRARCSAGAAATCAYVMTAPRKSGAVAPVGVAECRVERDREPGGRERPLVLQVFGRGDHGDRGDGPVGQQLRRHPQREGRLARSGRRHREEVRGSAQQVRRQCATLPRPQWWGPRSRLCRHPSDGHGPPSARCGQRAPSAGNPRRGPDNPTRDGRLRPAGGTARRAVDRRGPPRLRRGAAAGPRAGPSIGADRRRSDARGRRGADARGRRPGRRPGPPPAAAAGPTRGRC